MASGYDVTLKLYQHHVIERERHAVDCHKKTGPPILVSPCPNISKYLDLRIIYFNFAEIFGPPGTKNSEIYIFGPS